MPGPAGKRVGGCWGEGGGPDLVRSHMLSLLPGVGVGLWPAVPSSPPVALSQCRNGGLGGDGATARGELS